MLRRYPTRHGQRDVRRSDPVPTAVRDHVRRRDGGCVFTRLGIAHTCLGQLELDHVRASGALGRKSAGTADNLVLLCPWAHREKTLHGRGWRPVLLAWIDRAEREGG
jgi:5-methylcytosine-specific restriction endonuclease McrA